MCYQNQTVFSHNLALLSHQVSSGHHLPSSKDAEIVLSSHGGQVVYPAILDKRAANQVGYRQMRCIPGTLKWNEQNLRALMGKASLPKIQSRHISQWGTSFRARPNAFAVGSAVQRDKWDAPFNFSVNDIKGSSTLSISMTCPQQSKFHSDF